MKSTTTNTEIRRIMKFHKDGLNVTEISALVYITEPAVQHVIDVRFPKKRKRTPTKTLPDTPSEAA